METIKECELCRRTWNGSGERTTTLDGPQTTSGNESGSNGQSVMIPYEENYKVSDAYRSGVIKKSDLRIIESFIFGERPIDPKDQYGTTIEGVDYFYTGQDIIDLARSIGLSSMK